MKTKIILATIMIVVALSGVVKINAGTSRAYHPISSDEPFALKAVTKDNDINSSNVKHKEDIGSSPYVITRVFKVIGTSRVAYTQNINAYKGTKYTLNSYSYLTPLVAGDEIQLVLGTQTSTSDIVYTIWEYN